MIKIDSPSITWGGKTYTPLPGNELYKPTSVSSSMTIASTGYATTTTQTAADMFKEIDRRVKQIEKERLMDTVTYKGRTVVDISPGKSAYVKYMDNIIKINNAREFNITHECPGEPMRIELVVDSVETTRVNHYTPGLGDVYYKWDPAPRVIPKKTPWLDKRTTPKKVIFSGPATTILWKDGTKTTVKCQGDDEWAPDVGIAMCYLKKMLGNKGNFNNIFRQARKVSEVKK